VLGGVGARLAGGAGQLIDRPRRLCQQIQKLEPSGARERLSHHGDRIEERFLGGSGAHRVAIKAIN
jgi:hypothetical protein